MSIKRKFIRKSIPHYTAGKILTCPFCGEPLSIISNKNIKHEIPLEVSFCYNCSKAIGYRKI